MDPCEEVHIAPGNRVGACSPTYVVLVPKTTPKQHLWGVEKDLNPIHVAGLYPGEGFVRPKAPSIPIHN